MIYAALCDDDQKYLEEEARLILEAFEEKCIDVDLTLFNSPQELLDSKIQYDMVFADIEMPEMNGIELIRQLNSQDKECPVFFITNHEIYLDKAFDVNAMRFFIKPIDKLRLSDGIDHALERMHYMRKVISVVNFENKLTVTVPISSIMFIENIGRRTRIVSTEYNFITETVFSLLENQIENEVNYFAASHQSYFVNLNYVTAHDKVSVKVSYEDKSYSVPMARRRFNEFNKKMFLLANTI